MLTGHSWEMRNAKFAPALMLRITTVLLVIGATLVAGPAMAQFGNLFGGEPPRPPADIPNGPFPAQPPPPPYQDQNRPTYPSGASPAYPAAPPPAASIESQPLPPPPGAATAPPPQPAQRAAQPAVAPPGQRAVTTPPAAGASQQQPAAAAAAPAEDDTVVERPTAHIDNRRAVFAGLDKITGRTITFDAAIGETVQFGALQVTPRACYTRPPTEATNTDAFVEVDEVTLKGDIKRIFTGWMFASSPGLHAVEHPIYDVWLTGCASPIETSLAAAPSVQAAPPPAKPRHPGVPLRGRTPARQPSSAAPLD